jgi:hypothetical protein
MCVQIAGTVRHMNNIEKYHIFCTQKQNRQMNELSFDLNNPIFETIKQMAYWTNKEWYNNSKEK